MDTGKATETKSSSGRIEAWRLALFAAPYGLLQLAIGPIALIIPAFYAMNTAMTLTTVGTVLMATKIVDAITDPMMAFVTDRFDTRFGRRKPWVLIGAPIYVVGVYVLLTPPEDVGVAYFASALTLMYFGYTIYMVANGAWMFELQRDYDNRQRVMIFKTISHYLGNALFVLLPIALFPWTGSTEFSADILKLLATIVVVCLSVSVIAVVYFVPRGQRLSRKKVRLKDLLSVITGNKPFQIFLTVMVVNFFTLGILLKGQYLFLDIYLGIADKFPYIIAISVLSSLIALPFWRKVLEKKEKHKVFAFCAFSMVVMGSLYMLVTPGPQGFVLLIVITIAFGLLEGATMCLYPSMLGDIADYDCYVTSIDRSATYSAAFSLCAKVAIAIGGGLGFLLIDMVGFDVKGGTNTEAAEFGFRAILYLLPGVFRLPVIFLLFKYPLTRARHAQIMAEIKQRSPGEPVAAGA